MTRSGTRDHAAQKAGFGNARTFEQAKKVIDKGTPELGAAMDQGEVLRQRIW